RGGGFGRDRPPFREPFMIDAIFAALWAGVPASPGAPPAGERWSCESDNDGLPQLLSVTVAEGRVTAFDYTSMAPSAGGSTKYTCTVTADRADGESKWRDEADGAHVHPRGAVADEDEVVVTRTKQTVTLRLAMSPYNCGPSTPLASAVSITKGRKRCHDVEME